MPASTIRRSGRVVIDRGTAGLERLKEPVCSVDVLAVARTRVTGKDSTMAHQVQAGNARPKVRGGLAVFFLGLITGGIYTAFWWYRTSRDMAEFEGPDTRVNPLLETGLMGAGLIALNAAQFTARETTQGVNPVTGLTEQSSTLTSAGLAIVLGSVVFLWYVSHRLRSHMRRVMSRAGMLPEEMPGGVSFWACTVFLNVYGSSSSIQSGLNKLWERYPRWYKSLGGTREEVLGASTDQLAASASAAGLNLAGPMPAGTPMPGAGQQPGHAPPAYTPPLAAQAPAPALAPAQPSDPAQIMQALGARAQAGQLRAEEAFAYARAVEQVHGAESAAPWYEFVANSDPTNMDAMYWIGAWRLGRRDDTGLPYLHRAAQDPRLRSHAGNLMIQYLEQQGRQAEAAQWRAWVA
jgi:hypothetical protein